jgi:hypothetical protein
VKKKFHEHKLEHDAKMLDLEQTFGEEVELRAKQYEERVQEVKRLKKEVRYIERVQEVKRLKKEVRYIERVQEVKRLKKEVFYIVVETKH